MTDSVWCLVARGERRFAFTNLVCIWSVWFIVEHDLCWEQGGIPVTPNYALKMGGICIINGRFGDMVMYMVSEFYIGGADRQ